MFLKKLLRKLYLESVQCIKEEKNIPKHFYDSWAEANSDCEGYNSNIIFEKVKEASLAVKEGRASYERDSVLFYDTKKNYNLLSYINYYALSHTETIAVVDWGGALGSTYFQNKKMLPKNLTWTIVEQKNFVEFGKQNIADDVLHFEYSLEKIVKCDIIIFSGVLQYLDFAIDLLKEAISKAPDYIILERTQFGKSFKIWKYVASDQIFKANYPTCCFKKETIVDLFEERNYSLIDSWDSLVDKPFRVEGDTIELKSLVFAKK